MQTTDPTRPWELYSRNQRWFYLAVLFLASASNYINRQLNLERNNSRRPFS